MRRSLTLQPVAMAPSTGGADARPPAPAQPAAGLSVTIKNRYLSSVLSRSPDRVLTNGQTLVDLRLQPGRTGNSLRPHGPGQQVLPTQIVRERNQVLALSSAGVTLVGALAGQARRCDNGPTFANSWFARGGALTAPAFQPEADK